MGMRMAAICMRSASFNTLEAAAKAPIPINKRTLPSAIKALQTLWSTAKKKLDQLTSLGSKCKIRSLWGPTASWGISAWF